MINHLYLLLLILHDEYSLLFMRPTISYINYSFLLIIITTIIINSYIIPRFKITYYYSI